jgi:hypothetical protein
MKKTLLFIQMVAFGLMAPNASAEEGPSFNWRSLSWAASDIVVAGADKDTPGQWIVKEVWHGDLKPKQRISLPPRKERSRTISPSLFAPKQQASPPQKVTDERVVLFLDHKFPKHISPVQAPGSPASRDPISPNVLVPACPFWKGDSLHVSMAWVHKGKLYAWQQMKTSGPSLLQALNMDEATFKTHIKKELAARGQLAEAVSEKEPKKRALALSKLLRSENYTLKTAALQALGDCGPSALPILRPLLYTSFYQQTVVPVMYHAVGPKRWPAEAMRIFQIDLPYWKLQSDALSKGWWDDGSLASRVELKNHYYRLRSCLFWLKVSKQPLTPELREQIRAIQNLWASKPSLAPGTEILSLCKTLLNPQPLSPPKKPRPK